MTDHLRLGVAIAMSITMAAYAHEHQLKITVRDGYRYFQSNGIPDHDTGRFPNRGNPNTISPQDYTFRVTLRPKVNERPREMRGHLFGIALSGVPFDPGTAEFWNNDRSSGWNYDALSGRINLGLDDNNAHVQPTGAYHYHGLPTGVVNNKGNGRHIILVGFAADGFPIYNQFGYTDPNDATSPVREMKSSFRLREGMRNGGPGGRYDGTFDQDFHYVEGAGDLDECNGMFGVTPEYPDGIYHYHVTEDYPFVPRLFRGDPDATFRKGMGGERGGDRGNTRGNRRPPPRGGGMRPPPPR